MQVDTGDENTNSKHLVSMITSIKVVGVLLNQRCTYVNVLFQCKHLLQVGDINASIC